MSTGNKILIVVGGVFVLLLVFSVLVYPLLQDDQLPPPPEVDLNLPQDLQPLPSDQALPSVIEQTGTVLEPVTGEDMSSTEASQRAEVERLTRLFVERFGSYSNFSNFENITSIQGFMTSSMKQYAESFLDQETDSSLTADYYGVTTRLISLRIRDFSSESSATVEIIVQQEVQDGLNEEIVKSSRDGTVELIYRNGEWLIDGLFYN